MSSRNDLGRWFVAGWLLVGMLALGESRGRAAVTGLINTGADASGALLADGSVQPGWAITSVSPGGPPGGLTPPTPPSSAFVVPAYGYWLANGGASKWISYSSPLYQGGDSYRQFTYALDFTAAQGDDFYLRFSADNGTKVYLNQASSADLVLDWSTLGAGDYTPFASWSPWVKVSDSMDGQNSLICVVDNLSQDYLNPTGLRAEFSLVTPQVDVMPVPEPSTFVAGALLLVPFGMQGVRRWGVAEGVNSGHLEVRTGKISCSDPGAEPGDLAEALRAQTEHAIPTPSRSAEAA